MGLFKGFYNLTSAMLSQGKRLDVISNNMANVSTAGYKTDTYTDTTFREHMLSRVGNKDKSGAAQIGPASYILAPSKLYTDYSQGALEQTGMPLDFAIEGDGFFAVNSANGTVYTRAGSFALDDEGYLCQPDGSRGPTRSARTTSARSTPRTVSFWVRSGCTSLPIPLSSSARRRAISPATAPRTGRARPSTGRCRSAPTRTSLSR